MITLSSGLPDLFIDTFGKDVRHVCQQEKSLLESCVMHDSIAAEAKSYDMFDKMRFQAKEGRNVETPRNDVTTQRRWVFHDPYHNAYQFDKDDDLELICDPAGETVKGLHMGRNVKVDEIVIAAFDATVNSGRRSNTSSITWASQNGDVKYTESSGGRTIPHDCSEANCSASVTGMSTEKIELVQEYFSMNYVDPSIPIFGLIPPRVATQLFGQEEYVNVDYNSDKPLAMGRMLKYWMGINWIQHPLITLGSNNDVDGDTDVYECWFWTKDAITLAVADTMTVNIRTRVDLSDSQEVYAHLNMGAIRRDEDKVCKVECQAG